MTSRIQLVMGLAATMLEVVAIVFFIRWFSKTDWLMGHTKGAPTHIFTAFAAAAMGVIASVVWFALAVDLKLASSRSLFHRLD